MEFKGTKGKWYIYHNTQGYNSFCINSKYKWIHKDEEEANALLISKSPEFYEEEILTISELEDILKVINKGDVAFKLRTMVERKKQLIKEATEI